MAAVAHLADILTKKTADRPTQLWEAERKASADLASLKSAHAAAVSDIAAQTVAMYADNGEAPDCSLPLRLQTQIDATSAAVDAVRMQRREAIEATYKATAQDLRALRDAKRRDAEKTRKTAAKLLEELARVEGVDFMPGVAGVTENGLAVHRTPLSQRLENAARQLDQQANEQSQRRAADAGMAEAADAGELLVTVTGDPLNVSARADLLVAWAEEAEAAARAAYRKAHTGDEPSSVLFHVEWERGKLALSRCRVETPPDPETASRPPSTF